MSCCPYPPAGRNRRSHARKTAVSPLPSPKRVPPRKARSKGNSIGVFAIEPKTGVYWATNNKYTYDGRAFKPATEEDNIIVTVGTDLDFYVYYPFKEGQTDITAISHAIGDQQESPDGFQPISDSVLYGRNTGLYDTAAFRAPAVDRGGPGGRKRPRGRRPYGKCEIRQPVQPAYRKNRYGRDREAMLCTGTVPGTSPRYSG